MLPKPNAGVDKQIKLLPGQAVAYFSLPTSGREKKPLPLCLKFTCQRGSPRPSVMSCTVYSQGARRGHRQTSRDCCAKEPLDHCFGLVFIDTGNVWEPPRACISRFRESPGTANLGSGNLRELSGNRKPRLREPSGLSGNPSGNRKPRLREPSPRLQFKILKGEGVGAAQGEARARVALYSRPAAKRCGLSEVWCFLNQTLVLTSKLSYCLAKQ